MAYLLVEEVSPCRSVPQGKGQGVGIKMKIRLGLKLALSLWFIFPAAENQSLLKCFATDEPALGSHHQQNSLQH